MFNVFYIMYQINVLIIFYLILFLPKRHVVRGIHSLKHPRSVVVDENLSVAYVILMHYTERARTEDSHAF